MWNEEKITDFVKGKVNEYRFFHTEGVVETAVSMAEKYECDTQKAKIAALIHDCAKEFPREELVKMSHEYGYEINYIERKSPQLLHGLCSAIVGKNEMNIQDEDIFNAVRYHTTGRENMSILEKIVYLADYIEPSRNFNGVEDLRSLAFENIDEAIIKALEYSIKYVIKKGELIHTDTIHARNYLVGKRNL